MKKAKALTPEAAELADLEKNEKKMRADTDREIRRINRQLSAGNRLNHAAIRKIQKMDEAASQSAARQIAQYTNELACWLAKVNRRRAVLRGRTQA